jgi:hypothetical protein
MGLKGYRLWAMGRMNLTCRAPTAAPVASTVSVPISRDLGLALFTLFCSKNTRFRV